jgi:hypothetical protein
LNLNIHSIASGVSELSGVNVDYIHGIFNGTINPPFIAPLDCIDSLLMSYFYYLQHLKTVLVPQVAALGQASPSK